jgi:hypothetical protein
MFINEYGDKNNPLVLLLAPMMVSGEDLYQLMHPYFKHNYHYIAPDQGGHGKAGAYISADEEYKTLKSFLLDEGYREIELVYEEDVQKPQEEAGKDEGRSISFPGADVRLRLREDDDKEL